MLFLNWPEISIKGEHMILVFLDLSKAFDTLDYNLLFKKLEFYCIRGTALEWFKSYLSNRTMRTKCIVNEKSQVSEKKTVTFGVPQGMCLGPLLFVIFCNDLHHNLELTKCILFADDTTIYYSNKNLSLLIASVEHDLYITNDWFKANNLTLNKKKSVCILFKLNTSVRTPNHLRIDESTIKFVSNTKFLGVWIDEALNWNIHIDKLLLTLQRNSHMLLKIKQSLSYHSKKILYYAQIYSHITYGIGVWGPMSTAKQKHKIQEINKKCLFCISNDITCFLNIESIIKLQILKFGWKILNKMLLSKLQICSLSAADGSLLIKKHWYNTRNKQIPNVPSAKNKQYKSSIFYKSIALISNLPKLISINQCYKTFCTQIKKYLIEKK